MRRRALLWACLVMGWLAWPSEAEAAVRCQIQTVPVAFGTYNVFSNTVLTSVGNITVRCVGIGAGTTPITVFLNPGTSGSFQPRRMTRLGETLSYNLFLDANGTRIWGDGTSGTLIHSAVVSNNQLLNLPVFGRIPPGQDVGVGTYTDTIVATVNF